MYYIYRITNKINSKTYIGKHKYKDLNDNYKGSGKLLWRAYRKYGFENFEKEILYSSIQYKATADDMEKFAIAKERALGKAEYNIADGGDGGPLYKGKQHSEEWKKMMSETLKGRKLSEEWVKKISESNKGRKLSEETRKKMSESHKGMKGKHFSEESKKKISESLKGHTPWNKGKKTGSNGTHWYNNGKTNIKARECPVGFVKGRLVWH